MRRISVNGLIIITILALLLFAGLSIGAAQSDPPEIIHANINVWNYIHGPGDRDPGEVYNAFSVFIFAIGNIANITPGDIYLSINGSALTIQDVEVEQDGDQFRIRAIGDYEAIPILGEYSVEIKDAEGQISTPYIIGELLDFPEDAPELLYPYHEQKITETEPEFEWEAFQSEYNGQFIEPWGYEINLNFPDSSTWTVYPIPGNQTTIEFINPNWDPSQPPGLSPGVYGLTIHSNHSVAPFINFEHHRVIHFEVLDYLPISIDIKPGSDPNSINLGSRGVVSVAVLTTEDFDASTVDPVTVLFAGASPLRWSWEDVDYDGDIDLLFKFKILELDMNEYSSEAMLTGMTFDEIPVLGTDTVQVVP